MKNVLSLFDGMSCGQIALNRAGIGYDNYYASEIDDSAIKVTQANYPNTIHLGNVIEWRKWDIDWASIDLVMGGSPCQGFSSAGKGLAFDDPRSKLFFVFVDILNHVKKLNPNVKFLLENVKMKKEHLDVISDYLGVKPVFINSALVSAQNRQRYYWSNWEFGQPEDKGVMLADVLDEGFVDREKSYCVDANYFKGGNLEQYFNKSRRQLVFTNPAAIVGRKINEEGKRDDYNPNLKTKQYLEVNEGDKSRCLSTVQKDTVVSCLPAGRYLIYQTPRGNNPGGIRAMDGKTPTLTSCSWEHNNKLIHIANAIDINGHEGSKSRCLTTVQKDTVVSCLPAGRYHLLSDNSRVGGVSENERGFRPYQADQKKSGISEIGRICKPDSKTDAITTTHSPKVCVYVANAIDINGYDHNKRIYHPDGKAPNLLASSGGHKEPKIITDVAYRKLTPVECERLQTVLQYIKPVEIILCYDQAKSFVNAVEKNHKLLKIVSSVESEELKEYAKLAIQNMSASQASTRNTAPQNAGMQTSKQTEKCTNHNQGEQSSTASNAGSTTMCKQAEREVSSAIQSAFISITEGKITHCGKAESRQKEPNYTELMSGKIALRLCGSEMMQNAKDAMSALEMMQIDQHSTSITSFRLSTKNIEQMLTISYWFAKSAIDGFTQGTTSKKSLYVNLIDGYTAHVSKTQRYKMLGNGWTVDVIAHILKSSGLK